MDDSGEMNKKKIILITGASGFTGQHACNYFHEKGYKVVGVTRNSPLLYKDIKIEKCDLTDQNTVIKLIKENNPQFVLHLAGQNHVGDSWVDPVSSFESNVLSTLFLIEAVRKECPSCKIIVVGSALQFDLNNITTLSHPYSLSKSLQVLVARCWAGLYHMNIAIAKPSNLIGPGHSNGVCSIFARKIVDMEKNNSKKILEVNNLNAHRDFIDVRDAVRAYEILLLSGKSNEVYEISSGKSRSIEEVILVMKSLSKVNFKVESQTFNQIEKPIEIFPSKISALGWEPTIPLKTSINDILTFHRENFHNINNERE